VHALIASFLSFLALLYLFRFLYHLSPSRKWLFLFILFLVPTITFYGSGVHKEVFAITAIALIIPLFSRMMNGHARALPTLLLSMFLLYLVKDFYLAAILPCLLAWMVTLRQTKWTPLIFISIFVFYWLALFTISVLIPGWDVAGQIASKQEEFRILVGNSNVFLPEVNASIWGIVKLAPVALQHTLLRPWPAEAHSWYIAAYLLENALLLTFMIVAVIYAGRAAWRMPIFWFFLLFALASLIIIGVIVPNLGAISRYRAPALLFLLLGFAFLLDPKRLPIVKKYIH
jgi:hypothetical protein